MANKIGCGGERRVESCCRASTSFDIQRSNFHFKMKLNVFKWSPQSRKFPFWNISNDRFPKKSPKSISNQLCNVLQHNTSEIRVKSEVCLLIFFHFQVAPNWNHDGTHEINERNPSKSFKFPSSASLHKVLERFPTMPRGCFKILLLGARESWYFWHSPWSGWRAEIWKIFDFKIKYFSCLCQLSSAPQHFRLSHLERNNKSLSKVIFSDPSVASYKFSLSRLSSPPNC